MRELAGTVLFLTLSSILLAVQVSGYAPFLKSDAVKCQRLPDLKPGATQTEMEDWLRDLRRIDEQCKAHVEEMLDD